MTEPLPELRTCPACKRVLCIHFVRNPAIIDGEEKEICDSCFRRTGFPPVLTEVLPFDPFPSNTGDLISPGGEWVPVGDSGLIVRR